MMSTSRSWLRRDESSALSVCCTRQRGEGIATAIKVAVVIRAKAINFQVLETLGDADNTAVNTEAVVTRDGISKLPGLMSEHTPEPLRGSPGHRVLS